MFPSSHSLRARPQRRSASCIFSYNAGLGSLFGPRAGRPSLASCGNSQASVSLGAPPALPRCPHASLEPDPSLDTMRAHATRTGQGHTGIRTHVLGARVWTSHRHEPTSICPLGGGHSQPLPLRAGPAQLHRTAGLPTCRLCTRGSTRAEGKPAGVGLLHRKAGCCPFKLGLGSGPAPVWASHLEASSFASLGGGVSSPLGDWVELRTWSMSLGTLCGPLHPQTHRQAQPQA